MPGTVLGFHMHNLIGPYHNPVWWLFINISLHFIDKEMDTQKH